MKTILFSIFASSYVVKAKEPFTFSIDPPVVDKTRTFTSGSTSDSNEFDKLRISYNAMLEHLFGVKSTVPYVFAGWKKFPTNIIQTIQKAAEPAIAASIKAFSKDIKSVEGYKNYYSAWLEVLSRVPDGHFSLEESSEAFGPGIEALKQEEIGGGFGFALRMSDQGVIVNYICKSASSTIQADLKNASAMTSNILTEFQIGSGKWTTFDSLMQLVDDGDLEQTAKYFRWPVAEVRAQDTNRKKNILTYVTRAAVGTAGSFKFADGKIVKMTAYADNYESIRANQGRTGLCYECQNEPQVYEAGRKYWLQRYLKKHDATGRTVYTNDKTDILYMSNGDIPGDDWYYSDPTFAREFIEILNNNTDVKGIVIDFRNGGGGADVGGALFSAYISTALDKYLKLEIDGVERHMYEFTCFPKSFMPHLLTQVEKGYNKNIVDELKTSVGLSVNATAEQMADKLIEMYGSLDIFPNANAEKGFVWHTPKRPGNKNLALGNYLEQDFDGNFLPDLLPNIFVGAKLPSYKWADVKMVALVNDISVSTTEGLTRAVAYRSNGKGVVTGLTKTSGSFGQAGGAVSFGLKSTASGDITLEASYPFGAEVSYAGNNLKEPQVLIDTNGKFQQDTFNEELMPSTRGNLVKFAEDNIAWQNFAPTMKSYKEKKQTVPNELIPGDVELDYAFGVASNIGLEPTPSVATPPVATSPLAASPQGSIGKENNTASDNSTAAESGATDASHADTMYSVGAVMLMLASFI